MWIRRLLITAGFMALIATNLLTLTSTTFNAAISGLMSTAFGVQTVSEVLRSKVDSQKKTINRQKTVADSRRKAAKRFGTRLVSRTKRVAAAGIARLPGESLPFVGISILVAGTVYEFYEACQGLADLDSLYSELGIQENVTGDVMRSVCKPELTDHTMNIDWRWM